MKNQTNYTVNEVAEKTGVNSQTLRNWEKAGIIQRKVIVGNKKMFDNNTVEEIKRIKELRSQGVHLNGIQTVIKQKDKPAKISNKSGIRTKKTKENYSTKSITELTAIAKDKGVKYFRQMNKEELVEALQHPKNANQMSEQAKNRTKERYGDKKYGQNNKEISEANANLNKSLVENIIKYNNQGMSVAEILKKIK